MGIITLGFVACTSIALMRLVTTQEICLTVNYFKSVHSFLDLIVELMMSSQVIQGTRIHTGSYGQFRCEWVNGTMLTG